MHEIIRKTAVNALCLFLVSLFLHGLLIKGGFMSYIYAGVLLALFTVILDPIIKFITLPFNIVTLGLLSFLTTLVSLFLVAAFYNNVAVLPFTLQAFSLLGLKIGSVAISGFLSYVVISATIYFLSRLINWIFGK